VTGDVTIDAREVGKFRDLAARWWDPQGPMQPLHRMNPVRLEFILGTVERHLAAAPAGRHRLAGLRVLDVGCGAGLLCEPLARLGAAVTGLDPEPAMLEIARAHALDAGLEIAYEAGSVDEMAGQGRSFDLVIASEVIEHVADAYAFVSGLAEVTRPGGLVIVTTLSRTVRSLALAVIGAERILRWLPPGTHDWRRFLRPAELAALMRGLGLRPVALAGAAFDPAYARFRLTRDPRVNYLMAALRD